MVIINGYTTAPRQRQNRRRERPGARTRRNISVSSRVLSDYSEDILDALDSTVPLPSDKSNYSYKASPLLRQNFDQSWQRWKARQAEEQAQLAELEKMEKVQRQLEEQQRLFGGDVDDDELYRLGILHSVEDGDEDTSASHLETSISESRVACRASPVGTSSSPCFTVRQGKPRRSQRPKWKSLPLHLSMSRLQDDIEIALLLSTQDYTNVTPKIQHREAPTQLPPSPIVAPFETAPSPILAPIELPGLEIPQSLPTTSALSGSPISSAHGSGSGSLSNLLAPIDISLPPHSLEDWTFINTNTDTSHHSTVSVPTSPASEPETWILLSDDS